jgi:vesicle-fusing ATPase
MNLSPFCSEDKIGELAPGQIGLSMLHRQWIGLNEGDMISITPIDIAGVGQDVILGSLDLAIGFMKPRIIVEEVFSVDELSNYFHQLYNNMMCSPGQMFFFDYHGQKMKATVKGMV